MRVKGIANLFLGKLLREGFYRLFESSLKELSSYRGRAFQVDTRASSEGESDRGEVGVPLPLSLLSHFCQALETI